MLLRDDRARAPCRLHLVVLNYDVAKCFFPCYTSDPFSMTSAWSAKRNQSGLASVLSLWASWANEVCGDKRGQRPASEWVFSVSHCCNGITEEMKRMLGRDKNRVLWQSADFFSGEWNRKLASTAAYITELEMRVGSHATIFYLYFFLILSFSPSTHILTHSRSQPTLYILVHGSTGRYTACYYTTSGLKTSQYSHK